MKFVISIVVCAWTFAWAPLAAQQVGDRVLLIERPTGIPGQPAPGNNAVSHRFAGNTAALVSAIDAATGWFEIDDGAGNIAWITRTYIASVIAASPAPQGQCYRVGTWNLEHFGRGKQRGFPENGSGGPTFAPRTPAQIAAIAAAIRDQLQVRVLVLNEINGESRDVDGTMVPRSEELDDLVAHLGPTFDYIIGSSGNAQRVAILWDRRFAELEAATEMAVPRTVIGGEDIYARDPLVARIRFLSQGARQNDFILIGLHLASGQHRAENHDAAMRVLRDRIEDLRAASTVIPQGEHDLVLAGDLNASMFDAHREQFFDDMNTGRWAVLAGIPYPATRLAGVPLSPRSQIDYILVTRVSGTERGLLGEEITSAEALVHQELADGDWIGFRRTFSDHFPVTTCIAVITDND